MIEKKLGHVVKLPLNSISEIIVAEPKVSYLEAELDEMLNDLYDAVDNNSYIPQTPTEDNPSLSDDYIFDTNDENLILKDLKKENFVGKIKDLSKGATKRKARGLPEEYLYVFKYECRLQRRDAESSGVNEENILIYIKINDRKIPFEKVFVISFHKNKTR